MKPDDVIVIKSCGAISALSGTQAGDSYFNERTFIKAHEIEGMNVLCARLGGECEKKLSVIREDYKYKKLDRSVIMAIYAAREALKNHPQVNDAKKKLLINIGSSRGATSLFEQYHRQFLAKGTVGVQASPATTLGNISSWTAQDLGINADCLSTSVTCSTALQALVNSIAWLKSGMADFALAGASEAALTSFTLTQMKALRIYAEDFTLPYPCMPCAAESTAGAGMVLGEGAALFLLQAMPAEKARTESCICLESYGFGREQIESATSMSEGGECLYQSMAMAIANLGADKKVDLVLLHAPGTEQGDKSELNAVRRIFGEDMPLLLSNKWKIGHTFAAAGALNLDYALNILKNQKYAEFPYPARIINPRPRRINRIMLNAAGFGGNAASIIVSLNEL